MKCVVFGSHKGLGFECVKSLLGSSNVQQVMGFSRYDSGVFLNHDKYIFSSYDFTKVYDQEQLFEKLLVELYEFKPNIIIYSAGGGPFGFYGEKQWKDHEWALKLNLLFPAKLLWSLLNKNQSAQFLYVGSLIAESIVGDPLGTSYTASKWGMKGLFASLVESNRLQRRADTDSAENLVLHWFSPGYMDTELLPKGSEPRVSGAEIKDPSEVAKDIMKCLGVTNSN